MNRREFLKGGLSGLFGAFLTWAGALKVEAEEPLVVGTGRKSAQCYNEPWGISSQDVLERVEELAVEAETLRGQVVREFVADPDVTHLTFTEDKLAWLHVWPVTPEMIGGNEPNYPALEFSDAGPFLPFDDWASGDYLLTGQGAVHVDDFVPVEDESTREE